MNAADATDILGEVSLNLNPEMYFVIKHEEPDGGDGMAVGPTSEMYLQVRHPEIGSGRKWRLSRFMTKSEVVQTAFMAYLTWMEHEARESFTYKGQAIFSPHYDVEALVELSAAGKHDVR